MTTFTIEVTLELTDNDDDLRKILALLRAAEVRVNDRAQTEMDFSDRVHSILASSLERPHPPAYSQRIIQAFAESMAWAEARNQANRVLMTAFVALQKELIARKELTA